MTATRKLLKHCSEEFWSLPLEKKRLYKQLILENENLFQSVG